MPVVELSIAGEQLARLSEESVAWYLALGQTPENIAKLYRKPVARVEAIIARIERRKELSAEREAEAARRRFQRATSRRPFPPEELTEGLETAVLFRPAPELWDWVRRTFIEPDAPLRNPEHAHLRSASVGMLWTNVESRHQGRRIVGQCEMPRDVVAKWGQARAVFQLCQWFKAVPDFLITLDADHAARIDNASFCGLVEHELYHAGQAVDIWGDPRFDDDDRPIYSMRAHDFEGFKGVTERYGVGAAEDGVAEVVAAAGKRPLIARAKIAAACGTCARS